MSTADASRAALRADGETILRKAIRAVLPDGAVRRALAGVQFPGRVFLRQARPPGRWQALRAKCSPRSRAVWS